MSTIGSLTVDNLSQFHDYYSLDNRLFVRRFFECLKTSTEPVALLKLGGALTGLQLDNFALIANTLPL